MNIAGLLAFALASAFSGATLHVALVEQPARLALDDQAMLNEWRPSDHRGFILYALLSLLSALAALAGFRDGGDIRWLVGAIMMIASWPYVFFVILPLDARLRAMSPGSASPDARVLMRDWGLLQWGLSAIGLVSASVFAWALG